MQLHPHEYFLSMVLCLSYTELNYCHEINCIFSSQQLYGFFLTALLHSKKKNTTKLPRVEAEELSVTQIHSERRHLGTAQSFATSKPLPQISIFPPMQMDD